MSWFEKIKVSKPYLWIKAHRSYLSWAIITLLVIIIIFLWRRKETVIVTDKNNVDLIKKAEEWKDRNDKTWATLQNLVLSNAETLKRNDSLAKALGIKPQFIKGRDEYHIETKIYFDTIRTTTVIQQNKDTAYKVEKHDPWIDIEAIAGPREGSIDVQIRDTLTRVEKVKNPLIGRTVRETLIRNSNPYVHVNSGYSFSTKEKDVFLAIGPQVGVTYTGKGVTPYVGIGITLPIIKFRR